MVGCWFKQFTYHEGTSMRHRLIPAALAAGASLNDAGLEIFTGRRNGPQWQQVPAPEVTGLSALPSGQAWAADATFSATGASPTAFTARHTP
jgi:hypothetical protein